MHKALVVVLAALAGITLWLTLTDRDEPIPGPLAEPDIGSAAPATPADAVHAPLPGTTPERSAASTAAGTNDGERTRIAAAPGSAPAVAMLRGRLVGGDGSPRGGVQLDLIGWDGNDGVDMRPGLAGAAAPPERAPDATCTTAADGTFTLPLATTRSGRLELRDAPWVFAQSPPPVQGQDGDRDVGDHVVLRGGTIAGVVHDPAGRPVAGVRVSTSRTGLRFDTGSAVTTGADGGFTIGRLRPGTWTLRTASGSFLPALVEVELAAEQRRDGVVVVVSPGRAVAGRVVDDRGAGVAGAKVGSRRREARGALDVERFTPDEATTADAHGYFTLAGLAGDVVTVRAFGAGHAAATVADVQVGTGNLLLRLQRLGSVEGVLVDGDGAPIAGSQIEVAVAPPPADAAAASEPVLALQGLRARASAVSGADGTFVVDGVQPGIASVAATGATHRPARVDGVTVQPAAATTGVRLVADRGAIVAVTVTDPRGEPIAGAKVRASPPAADSMPGEEVVRRAIRAGPVGARRIGFDGEPVTATTGADGVATLAGLPADDIELDATHERHAPAVPARLRVPTSGVVNATMGLRAAGTAALRALDADGAPRGGAELVVAPAAGATAAGPGFPRPVTTGADGVATLERLAPGDYTVAFGKAPAGARVGDTMVFIGAGPATIAASRVVFTVVADTTVAVDVRRPVLARVHGTVRGADGPVAACTVELEADDADGPRAFSPPRAITDGDGHYTIDDVEPGDYLVTFGTSQQAVKAEAELDVPAGTADVPLDLTLRTGTLRLQVVAKGDGKPIATAQVDLQRASSTTGAARPRQQRTMVTVAVERGGNGGESAEATTVHLGQQRGLTDEHGVVVFTDVPVGIYTARVSHDRHAPVELKDQTVAETQVTDCGRVQLDLAGSVRGRVVGADGAPAGFVMVRHRAPDTAEWSQPTFAPNGSFRVNGLAAGRWVLRATPMGPQPSAEHGPETEVDVVAGQVTTAELRLER